ncbi:hypothetical protein GHT06_021207 [Daphnia sinensis]|uniref:Uncharacterized protein n=1 Tax=Daphnia sinensis TaxID=1820382 RepID=A0AAD5KIV1_9CRUS|nr:hypothetical protein GHT06_021207 [Daphnia sinensis]
MSILLAILLFCAAGCLAEDLTAAEQYRPAYKSEYPAHRPAYPEPKYPSYSKPSYPSYPSHSAYPAYPKYCDPKAAPKCAENSTGHWCLTDEEYPVYEIKSSRNTPTLPTNPPMIWSMESAKNKKRNSITLSTKESNSTRATGLVVRVSSAPATSLILVPSVPRTLLVNGASSSRTSPGPPTPRPNGLRLACSQKPLAALWLHATSANAFRSTPSTACSPLTLVMSAEVSSSIPTSFHLLALATSPSRLKLANEINNRPT